MAYSVLVCITFAFANLFTSVNSYRILVVDLPPAKSHHNLGKAVAEILTESGHDVTYVSSFSTPNAKFRDVAIVDNQSLHNETVVSIKDAKQTLKLETFVKTASWILEINKKTMENPMVRDIIDEEHFDAVILEHFLNDALIGLGVHFRCPVVLLSPIGLVHSTATLTENPSTLTRVPNPLSSFTTNMNLKQRLINVIMHLSQRIVYGLVFEPMQSNFYSEYFGEESNRVPYDRLHSIVSGAILNTHPSLGYPRPLLPNVVEVAGFHIKEEKQEKLPENIERLLNNANAKGVIYFSMGSNVKSSQMDNETKNDILQVLKSIDGVIILWKFEERIENLPANVHIANWLPQNAILGHPNTRLFITHGGLLSITEAVHHGVPTLVIPIFGDQFHNAYTAQNNGCGLVLEYDNITRASFQWAVEEVLNNRRYSESAKRLSRVYHDRPMKPADALTFHVEHIIRTNGARHLTPKHMSTLSALALDVIFIIAVSSLTFVWSAYKAFVLVKKLLTHTIKEKSS